MSGSPLDPLPVERFDYELPPELVAQQPVEPRDASRLLLVSRRSGSLSDRTFRDLPEFLHAGDLLILNDTRVLPARLFAQRATGGRVELLLLAREPDGTWNALARPARRLRAGEALRVIGHDELPCDDIVHVVGRGESGARVRFDDDSAIDRHGRVPLPPYIHEELADPERYQTVVAREEGSAAAPTAGLHFTQELIQRCRDAGAVIATVTLHVGLDTFAPITTDDARQHVMHSEAVQVPSQTLHAIRHTKRNGGRVLAVGTTSARTLESIADAVANSDAETDISTATRLFITPGYRFRVVDGLITNFHLPRTTLLLLVSAFAGEGLIRSAYAHAVGARYRFYSFGDAMLIV